ncbi:MAG TPA: extracellular solute-binding protein [Actinocrinis sp.]|nr:extracellular solute-binding protein [Actinocrinis sp.]
MKRKIAAAAVAAVALGAAACSSSSNTSSGSGSNAPASLLSTAGAGKTITVWIMSDAQKGWPAVVSAANSQFTAATGAKVNVVYQNWTGYIAKYTSALAGSTGVPDVIEIGDTDTTTFAATGALEDITGAKGQFENSGTWLSGLEQSSTYNGKLYAVPYYAGDRIVIYRKDLWTAAGITGTPTTFADLTADLDKLNAKYGSNANFSAMLTPGEDWYTAMSFVYGAGGNIATQSGGKWTGNLESAQAQKGLANWASLATKYSKGVTTVNEANQDALAAVGSNVGSIYGAGWEAGSITSATGSSVTADKLGYFQMPESAAFAGGSDLAVPTKAANAGLGAEWIKFYTSNAQMTSLAKAGAIPNTTSLLSTFESGGDADAAMGPAVQNGSWVTPASTNWGQVEAQHVLENMLQSIATGKSTTAAAAASADQQLNQILNAS